jgi:hypothetical protein
MTEQNTSPEQESKCVILGSAGLGQQTTHYLFARDIPAEAIPNMDTVRTNKRPDGWYNKFNKRSVFSRR